ncbi:hypothetical protein V7150_08365 [Neobacillus drentensis]|uniref:hypothetical protein n=1 Tax=Neobacillus drentensis TaxID=220684 RepID=UPI002FFDF625
MAKEAVQELGFNSTSNDSKNDVRVNNHFSLTINFGDSLSLLALLAGIYIIRRITKNHKNKAKKM